MIGARGKHRRTKHDGIMLVVVLTWDDNGGIQRAVSILFVGTESVASKSSLDSPANSVGRCDRVAAAGGA